MALFRALRREEIEAGFVLIPKSTAPFRGELRLPFSFPVRFGPSVEHAIREHQWDSKFPTRGISCTTLRTVAERYAARNGVIVRIDTVACERHGISLYAVKEHVNAPMIEHPEDDEVILVWEVDGTYPKDVVAEVIDLKSK